MFSHLSKYHNTEIVFDLSEPVIDSIKQYCRYIKCLKWKLQMMGISCNVPAYIEADNQSVLCNTSIHDSTLKKKSQSIAYQMVRERATRDGWITIYLNMHGNEANLLTKQLSSEPKRKNVWWTSSIIFLELGTSVLGGLNM